MSHSENKNMADCTAGQGVLFQVSSVNDKRVEVSFTGSEVSSDGGLLLLKESEQQIGIIQSISSCIKDNRHKGYVSHTLTELLTQRVFQIAAGYEDANDCNALRNDNIFKLCANRLPHDGALASQPTMSRFENKPSIKELYRIAEVFVEHFIKSYKQEPEYIILDCDDTNSNVYGEQQLSLFNNYYGEYCYMPLHIYEGASGKLVTTVLKPGSRSKNVNVFAILKRILIRLRKEWKNTLIIVRGDGHFCNKQLMEWCAPMKKVQFITGLTSNSVLYKQAACTIESAKNQYKQTKKTVKRYHTFEYKAASWQHSQRVIVKVEVSDQGTNIRFVVTDIRSVQTKALYENGYCARGAMELRIKEHKNHLHSNRMSCSNFAANQFRLFLHSAAYVLLHTLQTSMLGKTQYAVSTFKTIREKIIKVAAYVVEMKTKIKIEFPTNYPQLPVFRRCLELFEAQRSCG